MSDRNRQRLRTAVVALSTAALVVPAAAWAGNQFNDVPESNIFHDDIDWMRDNGVTAGCNPPANDEYCPDENVTREQMAAFLHRLDTKNVFVRPGDGAVDGGDADTVDGMHASDFLGATEQAVDSDKVDGLDSDAFARSENYHAYFETINGATDVTIAEFGPFTVLGRCDPGNRVSLIVTSSVADWYEEDETGPIAAGDEVEVISSTSTNDVNHDIDEGVALSENAAGDTLHYLGYDGESTLLGLGVYGHDCIVAGSLQMNTTAK